MPLLQRTHLLPALPLAYEHLLPLLLTFHLLFISSQMQQRQKFISSQMQKRQKFISFIAISNKCKRASSGLHWPPTRERLRGLDFVFLLINNRGRRGKSFFNFLCLWKRDLQRLHAKPQLYLLLSTWVKT